MKKKKNEMLYPIQEERIYGAEEVNISNETIINALIKLLIEKEIITKKELNKFINKTTKEHKKRSFS